MSVNRAAIGSIRMLLDAFDPASELLHVARPVNGLANEIHFLQTTRSDLVLKVYDDEAGAWKPRKEQVICSSMRDLGIPAPEILLVDSSKTVVPFAYSLSERIQGEALSRVLPASGDDVNRRIYRQLGDYLGRLHATTFDRFGDVSRERGTLVVGPAWELDRDADGRPRGPFVTWREMHREIVRTRLRSMSGTAFVDLVPAVARWLDEHDDCLDGPIVPRLLHMDLHPGNVLVRDGRVAGMLDVEESIVGHNEYDLMRTELGNFRGQNPAFERAFMDAYSAQVALDNGVPSRKPFYDVSRSLAWIQSLILNADARSRDRTSRYGQDARSHVLALVSDGMPPAE